MLRFSDLAQLDNRQSRVNLTRGLAVIISAVYARLKSARQIPVTRGWCGLKYTVRQRRSRLASSALQLSERLIPGEIPIEYAAFLPDVNRAWRLHCNQGHGADATRFRPGSEAVVELGTGLEMEVLGGFFTVTVIEAFPCDHPNQKLRAL